MVINHEISTSRTINFKLINHKQKIIGTIVSIGYTKKEKLGPVNEEFKTH